MELVYYRPVEWYVRERTSMSTLMQVLGWSAFAIGGIVALSGGRGGWAIFSMLGLILVLLATIQRTLDVLGKTLADRE